MLRLIILCFNMLILNYCCQKIIEEEGFIEWVYFERKKDVLKKKKVINIDGKKRKGNVYLIKRLDQVYFYIVGVLLLFLVGG